MKLSKILAGLIAIAASSASMAADVLLVEGFDDYLTLPGKGWSLQNLSTPIGGSGWFQGTGAPASFDAAAGGATSYIAANFLNAAPGGSISNWLMTPVVNINSSVSMSFSLRLLGLDQLTNTPYLDTVQVYYSTAGASTSIASFSLLTTYSSLVDTGWISSTVNLAGVTSNTTGRFAFRYVVANTDTAGNYIGIDSVSVTAVPEPASVVMVGLGLAVVGVAARRRRLVA